MNILLKKINIEFPSSGGTYPSATVPSSTSAVSGTGLSQLPPPTAAVTGTASTLTDSVFLSGTGSSRKNYEQSLFPSLVRCVNEKKSARKKIGPSRKLGARGARPSLPRGADFFFSPVFFFRSRDGLSWERGTASSLVRTLLSKENSTIQLSTV